MLLLDFINVGNGDSALIRQVEDGKLVFSMLVDCGHDNLFRDDHPPLLTNAPTVSMPAIS